MMSAAENAAARVDADLYFPAHVKTLYQKFRVDAGEKIDGHETYLVVGSSEGLPPMRLFLDRESGLLLRLIRYAETPLGRNPTQIDYADYRDANGVKIPFRWTLARPGNRFHHSGRAGTTKCSRGRRQICGTSAPGSTAEARQSVKVGRRILWKLESQQDALSFCAGIF